MTKDTVDSIFKKGVLTASVIRGVAIASACLPALALAQDESVGQAAGDTRSGKLEEVIVTANRRDQNLLEIPMSISVYTGESLEANLQDDLADYFRLTPGVTMTQASAGLNSLSIRGVSGGGGQRAKAPVSFYIDDVPVVSDPVASPDIKTFDIERVEVLRGPQGTLFGESALGGVVRIISKKPNLQEMEGKIRVSALKFDGGDPGYTMDFAGNLPIIEDTFALRLNLSRRDEGGWIDNIAPGGSRPQNDLDYWNSRITALWNVNERLQVSAMGYGVRSEYGGGQDANKDYEQEKFVDETRSDDIDQFNLTLKYDLGFAELVSSSNHFQRETGRLFDLTFFNGFLPGLLQLEGAVPAGFVFDQFWQTLDIDDESFVQEVRLVSSGESALRWVGGLYYSDNDNDVGVDFLGSPAVSFEILRLRREENYKQKAIFGEVEYDFADKWTLVAGVRYTEEERTVDYDQQDDWAIWPGFLSATGLFRVKLDYDIWTPKLALKFTPSDNTQIYFSATEGFRGPGANTDSAGDTPGARNTTFDAETLWSYELGGKGQFLDNKLSAEAAVFFSDWSDRQETVNPEAPVTEQFADNVGEAEIKGVELVLSYSFDNYFTVGGQASYIETEILKSATPGFEGSSFVGQPEKRGAVFVDALFPLSGGLALTAYADLQYQGDVIWSVSNPIKQGSYKLANAVVGVEGDSWNVKLFVRNLTNEFIQYGAGVNTNVAEPRSYGVSVAYDF